MNPGPWGSRGSGDQERASLRRDRPHDPKSTIAGCCKGSSHGMEAEAHAHAAPLCWARTLPNCHRGATRASAQGGARMHVLHEALHVRGHPQPALQQLQGARRFKCLVGLLRCRCADRPLRSGPMTTNAPLSDRHPVAQRIL
jgi:hypothetical protein